MINWLSRLFRGLRKIEYGSMETPLTETDNPTAIIAKMIGPHKMTRIRISFSATGPIKAQSVIDRAGKEHTFYFDARSAITFGNDEDGYKPVFPQPDRQSDHR